MKRFTNEEIKTRGIRVDDMVFVRDRWYAVAEILEDGLLWLGSDDWEHSLTLEPSKFDQIEIVEGDA